ncbi:MAG: hypothetical protein WCT04_07690 [Planctomycetota bacterium]
MPLDEQNFRAILADRFSRNLNTDQVRRIRAVFELALTLPTNTEQLIDYALRIWDVWSNLRNQNRDVEMNVTYPDGRRAVPGMPPLLSEFRNVLRDALCSNPNFEMREHQYGEKAISLGITGVFENKWMVSKVWETDTQQSVLELTSAGWDRLREIVKSNDFEENITNEKNRNRDQQQLQEKKSWMEDYVAFTYKEMAKEVGKSSSSLQENLPGKDIDGKPIIRTWNKQTYWLKTWYFANRKNKP